MKTPLVLFLSLLLSCSTLFGATVKITGQSAPVYKGKMAYLYAEVDAISNRKSLSAKTEVDENGNFLFNAEIAKTVKAFISINRVSADLFLAPNANYNVAFPDLASNQLKSFGGVNKVDLVFYELDKEDPNFLISLFNQGLEKFNRDNVDIAFTNAYNKKALEFWRSAMTNYSSNEFVKQYVHFACANTLLNGGLNQRKVFEYFLDSTEVSVNNPEFGVFAGDFFKNILEETDRIGGEEQVKITINVAPRAFKLLEELRKNDYLADLKIREIVALQGLQEIYPRDGYNQANILDLINQIGVRTIYDEVKLLAENISFMLTWLAPGYEIPEFAIENYDGEAFRSTQFKGKPTLYVFWAPWSKVALDELVTLSTKKSVWDSKINLVLISVGESTKEDKAALSALGNLQVPSLSYKKHPQIIDELQVISIPHYMFVDAEGKLLRHFSPSLDEMSPFINAQLKALK